MSPPAEAFENWSGSLRFTPGARAAPRDEDEVVDLVAATAERGGTIRPVGSGHSSTPLMATDDVLVSLEHLTGMTSHDTEGCRATFLPGTQLADAGSAAWEVGLALENLGDVDYQALAGAMATGTHGTGRAYPNLSMMLVGGRLVTGSGEVVTFDEHDDDPTLLRAVRVALGALGILTELRLRLVPAVELQRTAWCTHIDWVLDHFHQLVDSHRHLDVYWYPRSDLAQVRATDEVGHETELVPPGRVHRESRGPGHEIIPQSRHLKFDEMEYMVPLERGLECFRAARQRIRERHRATVGWRVLLRTVAADDTLISNCHGRDTMTIALLHNAGLPHDAYFSDMEPLLQEFGGRPHWGKKHSMTATQLRPLFPDWDSFQDVRRSLDPDGVFMNDHLRRLFEESAQ